MYEILIDGELYHHGVKGQKWGVRKKRGSGNYSSLTSDEKKRYKKYKKESHKAAIKANDYYAEIENKNYDKNSIEGKRLQKQYESEVKKAQKYLIKQKDLAFRNLKDIAIETGKLYISTKKIEVY